MNKITAFALFLTLLFSCVKQMQLADGLTRVPLESKIFKNKKYFHDSLITIVDTFAIYQEYFLRTDDWQSFIKFYPNGNFNYFVTYCCDIPENSFFDPETKGYRGIYYAKKGDIKGDLYTCISGGGGMGISEQIFEFRGDTLIVQSLPKSNFTPEIYIKRKLPQEYFRYKADW